MIPIALQGLQSVNDPTLIVVVVTLYSVGYYVVSFFFHRHTDEPNYSGPWKRSGAIDIITSFLWLLVAVVFVLSLLDLVIRNALPLSHLLAYYVLWIFLFAFIYNILDWHWPGFIAGLSGGWTGELQCLTLSISAMTTGGVTTSARPGNPLAEALTAVQSLLGLLMIVVFIAKAVSALPGR